MPPLGTEDGKTDSGTENGTENGMHCHQCVNGEMAMLDEARLAKATPERRPADAQGSGGSSAVPPVLLQDLAEEFDLVDESGKRPPRYAQRAGSKA
mgnify:CR=1 FL=1